MNMYGLRKRLASIGNGITSLIFGKGDTAGGLKVQATDNTSSAIVTVTNAAQSSSYTFTIPAVAGGYFGVSTAALTKAELDVLDGALSSGVVASKAVIADANSKLNLAALGSAAASASGLLYGVGTSANPAATSTAGAFFTEIRAKNTATSGDNRLDYRRFELAGANPTGGGECLRAFTTMGAIVDTARGGHISLVLNTAGRTTGTGTGLQSTLQVPAGTNTGQLFAHIANIWLDSASAMTMPTEHGIIRLAVDGDATQNDAVKYAINFSGVQATAASSGVTDMVTTGCADATSDTRVKVRINGTDYWLLASSSAPSA